ncbi:hypothetical protein HDF19_08670 [Mucilaginibacter sp. E4BP6]|uniref:hypothetical protein n=1 Tax=Mucilaginibacter sp. E4BP6 TaxID=2723089 RepID=UPI0015C733BE|nr:hypothetical protein [Mucilaginibacter sp. E4BP6]NYE68540.1 hypothetical protein [Mucilaginibacter sp. E4BP6]
MKKLLIFFLLTIAVGTGFAQSVPKFDQYKFNKDSDYKLADSAVLQTANFLLSTPIDQNIPVRLKAGQFVMRWMEGTPDYTFSLEQAPTKYLSGNVHLMLLYMTSMAKYALETRSSDVKAITINGVKTLLAYVNNPVSNVKKDKNLKKLSDANDKGNLEYFLSL